MAWNFLAGWLIGLAYLSALMLVVGVAYRIFLYLKTPAPLKIVLTPGPQTGAGVIGRLAGDAFIFPNLFRADKLLWAGAWIFHLALLCVFVRHARYFIYPIPDWLIDLQPVGIAMGFILPLPALYLLWRRLVLPRNLYISGVPDYIALGLILAIAATGILVSFYARVYLVDVKAFLLGLIVLKPVAPPQHPLFLAHLILVCSLMIYFPFSKLMHAGGIFFSPTRNQRDNVLAQRYVNPWNEEVTID
jgi:nitrate reductase gamma subunit